MSNRHLTLILYNSIAIYTRSIAHMWKIAVTGFINNLDKDNNLVSQLET